LQPNGDPKGLLHRNEKRTATKKKRQKTVGVGVMGKKMQCCGCRSHHGIIGENNMSWFSCNVKEKDGTHRGENFTRIKKHADREAVCDLASFLMLALFSLMIDHQAV
jgi:hypothetical protein